MAYPVMRWLVACLAFAVGCGRIHFDPSSDARSVSVDTAAPDGPAFTPTIETYIKASNTDNGDRFAEALALSGDGLTLAVGAFGESSNALGIDGNQADNSALEAGAVYVIHRASGAWTQQAYIKASNTDAFDTFGFSVTLSSDGNLLAVGCQREASSASGVGGNQADNSLPNAGAVYVFVRTGATWTQQAYLKASNPGNNDGFGTSVALSSDGATLAVGAVGEDSAAVGIDGNQGDNSAAEAGAAYVFVRNGTAWAQQAYVKASNAGAGDGFGERLALSGDGATLAIGADTEESAAVGIDGNQADNSLSASGAAYVFTRTGTTWTQQAYVKSSAPTTGASFGASLALDDDGGVLIVGSPGEGIGGTVHVFDRAGSTWAEQAVVTPAIIDPYDSFGGAVAISANGTNLAVGAALESSAGAGFGADPSDNSLPASGAAYVFAQAGTVWMLQAFVKATTPDMQDAFGTSIAMSAAGDELAIGAYNEQSNATGIDGDSTDNSIFTAGAAYVVR